MEEFLHPSDDLNEPLPPESQALLDRFKAYAVWHPRLLQVRTQVLDTVWEPADVVFVVVCGPSGVGKSKLAEVLTNRLNTPKPELNGQNPRRALLINTRPPDGELFHRTNFYQKGLTLLGKTTFDRHIKVDVATAEHLVEKKRARGKTTTRYPDDPEMRDVYYANVHFQTTRSCSSLDAADRRSEDTQAEGTYRRAISLSRSSGNSATGGRSHPLFILRTNQIGGSSLAGIESPRSAMLNVRFGEQSQVERAIRRDFAASPTQVATSAQCHTLDGTGK